MTVEQQNISPAVMERWMDNMAGELEARALARSNKAVTSLGSYAYPGHGPGVFTPVMDPNVINAVQMPTTGLSAILPEMASDDEFPVYGIISGQTMGTDTVAPGDDCSPWGTAGFTQICRQFAQFGTQGVTTPVVNLNRIGRTVDRADFQDYRLIGDPFYRAADTTGKIMQFPGQGNGDPNAFLNNDVAKIMREMEFEEDRRFAFDLWTSNPSNSADAYHTAWYRGMQLQVNTGYEDVVTQTSCPAVDSVVINFAQVAITGTAPTNITSNANAAGIIVDLAADLVYTMEQKATEMGLDPVQWVFVGSRELFRELTAVWPCSYMTARCLTASAGTPLTMDATEQVRLREDMRSRKYLLIDGKEVPFIIDTTVTQTQSAGAAGAGTFTSDLYYLPLTVRGNFPVLFKTYFNYNKPGAAADAIRRFGSALYGVSVSPNGKYLFSSDKTFECFKIKATTRPGLVLRTPFLAARITNITYKPRLVTPNWNPSAPSYYNGGGVALWNGTAPSNYYKNRNGE